MKIGYARVSTDEQNLDLQRHALQVAGCEAVYEDQGISGAENARPGLAQALGRIGSGDVLVVWKLDRLGRSLLPLIQFLDGLGRAPVPVSPRCRKPSTPRRPGAVSPST